MNMKQHILAALREQIDRWEELLSELTEAQISAPLEPSHWTVKDEMAHLMAWQQRSIARFEAALLDREPVFPLWVAGLNPDGEGSPDPINAWIYGHYREEPWPKVHQDWRSGYERLLEICDRIPERDLMDQSRYAWLDGYPLAYILLATYDHHQEHLEKLQTWLLEHGSQVSTG